MYSYTPPAVIAVDAEWLGDLGDLQRIAYALHRQLTRRPVWAVVGAPNRIAEAGRQERAALLEGFYVDPRDAPRGVDEPAEAVALALRHHLTTMGVELPLHYPPVPPQPHAGASAIMPGTWRDAAQAAKALASPQVVAWAADEEWAPRRVSGVPFHYERPDQPLAGSWDGAALL